MEQKPAILIKSWLTDFIIFVLVIGLAVTSVSCDVSERAVKKNIQEMIAAKKSGESEKMERAMQTLTSFGKPAIPQLIALLQSSDSDQVALSQLVLMRMGKTAEPDLINHLASPDPAVKKSILAIFELQNAESVIPAISRLLADPSTEVRFKAAGLLYKFKRAEGINFLKSRLISQNEDDRVAAIQEIIRYHHPESRSILLQSLNDASELVKLKVIEGLANLPMDKLTLDSLNIVRVNDRAWQVRLAAAKAMIKITGNKITYRNRDGLEIFPDRDDAQ